MDFIKQAGEKDKCRKLRFQKVYELNKYPAFLKAILE
jgi:hypothetical protein